MPATLTATISTPASAESSCSPSWRSSGHYPSYGAASLSQVFSLALSSALSNGVESIKPGPSRSVNVSKVNSERAPMDIKLSAQKVIRKSPPNSPAQEEFSEKLGTSNRTHRRDRLFGKRLSVVNFDYQNFLIGVQVATLLKRETFNMYRSMKIKNINLVRATPEQVDYLTKVNAVRSGTHSVTLIPYQEGLYFIADARHKISRFAGIKTLGLKSKKAELHKSFIVERPKLHRRKAYPWDVHRAIHKEEFLQILKAEKSLNLCTDQSKAVASP